MLVPLAHADGFTRSLGFDARDPAFVAEWKCFVAPLALSGLRGAYRFRHPAIGSELLARMRQGARRCESTS